MTTFGEPIEQQPRQDELPDQAGGQTREPAREEARKRLQSKRDFRTDLLAYVVVNSFLVGVWAFTGAGYFWPAWVLAGWGVGLVLHGYDVFFRRPVSEADIDRELSRGR